jgi:hypothetical protein
MNNIKRIGKVINPPNSSAPLKAKESNEHIGRALIYQWPPSEGSDSMDKLEEELWIASSGFFPSGSKIVTSN